MSSNGKENIVEIEANTEFKTIERFEEAEIPDNLLRGIYGYGWEFPSETQKKGIPAILTGRDTIIQAQSGTGKTGTFTVSLLSKIIPDEPTIQGIIVVPTIELANQVYNVITAVGEYMNVNFIECVGGKKTRDILTFPDRATVLIGTPGRLSDICEKWNRRDKPQPFRIRMLVVDEFDKTLSQNFREQVYIIFKQCVDSAYTQVVLSSATIDSRMRQFLPNLNLNNPIEIYLENNEVSLKGIEQFYVDTEAEEHKYDTIIDIFKSITTGQCIIFFNSKQKCVEIADRFIREDYSIGIIHGDMEPADRTKVMSDFRSNVTRILLSTELTARGIDIQTVSLVINYDIPSDYSQYIHRIGRTSRYGRKGFALNLIYNDSDFEKIRGIEQYYGVKVVSLPENFSELFK